MSEGDGAALLDLLKKQVFSEIAVDRFVEIVGLGASGLGFVPLSDALDGFFSFLDQPKMRSDVPLLAALAAAVERRLVGYVPAAQTQGEELILESGTRVRFGQRFASDEFVGEDSAYLVSAELAGKRRGVLDFVWVGLGFF